MLKFAAKICCFKSTEDLSPNGTLPDTMRNKRTPKLWVYSERPSYSSASKSSGAQKGTVPQKPASFCLEISIAAWPKSHSLAFP